LPPIAKTWHLLPSNREAAAQLARGASISPVVAQLLINRGITDATGARAFLDAPLASLHPPGQLPGIGPAADRIVRAVAEHRRICVYGDYDVDGTTGTALLLGILRRIGAEPEFYVPNRMDEGYGLNCAALQSLAASGVSVVVTVDCGITSVAEAEEANRLGLELIVTDHHEMTDRLPAAAVLVHPRLPGSAYPHPGLCGAGVALKLAWAIAQRASGSEKVNPEFREFLLDAVGLAALGAVADVVPLRDETRVIVRHGLERLACKPTVGIAALIEAAGIGKNRPLRADDIGFRLAPRINAAGRLECARLVIELLTTTSLERAREIAGYLENLNQQRQALERKIVAHARDLVEANGYDADPGIVLASADWHPGVIGIVASRLVEQYCRPVLLVALKEGEEAASGSGRSVGDFPLHEALRACDGELLSHGGHAAAAGFKVHPSRLTTLRERFVACAAAHFGPTLPAPRLVLEEEVPLAALTFNLMSDLDRLEPYGAENPRPRFLATGLKLDGNPRKIGGGERHLSFRVRQGSTVIRAVAFGMGDRLEELLSGGGACSLAFTPKVNEWQDRRSVELEVADFRPVESPELA
jgi:single-stranded-DNA-specific exonuclease